MDDKQRKELVQLVANEAVKVLRQRKMIGPTDPAGPAQVSPPIGVCTAASAPATAPLPNTETPLTGIITARKLQEAMDASPEGVALLAPTARLSPLANDLARRYKDRIRRASPIDQSAKVSAAAGGQVGVTSPWLYWIQRTCPVADRIVADRTSVLRPMSTSTAADALPQVVRDLAGAIKSRSAPGGIIFVPSAAKAMCYANRCPSLRAVVGTCSKAVEEGIDYLGANVMVIEYPHHGPESMGAMVDLMIKQAPSVPPQIERDLADLQRCG